VICQNLNADYLDRQQTQGVTLGVAVVVPRMESVALVVRVRTWTVVHWCTNTRQGVAIFLGVEGKADFVIGSRTRGRREPGSMNFHQVLAGYMVGFVLRMLYGVHSTDMGPFRAIRRATLARLGLREETYGWPLEMQMRAARAHVRTIEVAVDYRRRAGGHSKIAGTLRGSVLAATRILITLARLAIQKG